MGRGGGWAGLGCSLRQTITGRRRTGEFGGAGGRECPSLLTSLTASCSSHAQGDKSRLSLGGIGITWTYRADGDGVLGGGGLVQQMRPCWVHVLSCMPLYALYECRVKSINVVVDAERNNSLDAMTLVSDVVVLRSDVLQFNYGQSDSTLKNFTVISGKIQSDLTLCEINQPNLQFPPVLVLNSVGVLIKTNDISASLDRNAVPCAVCCVL